MKRFVYILCVLLIFSTKLFATHQRAAEIVYKHLGGLTYEITLIMYTYTPSPADDTRTSLPIKWGDNTESEIPRIVFQDLPDNYTLNIYQMNHTFSAVGTYLISVEDPNRNFGVVNIPNSVNVPIYVESLLVINPYLGPNNSVQLLNPPIDQGCVGKLFVHNPSAFDVDGDSLSFHLVNCRGADGLEIPGYTFPMASSDFRLDPQSGDLIWENPVLQGEYNVAFVVEEWRNGIKIGSVMRDMQILIGACDNEPPIIEAPDRVCSIAGKTPLQFDVSATDPDGNAVMLTASGGPFEMEIQPAEMNPNPASGTPTAHASFHWSSLCEHIRPDDYKVLFKARDVHHQISLTALHTTKIKLVPPPVEQLQASPLGTGIDLQWLPYDCPNAKGFYIYRATDSSGFVPDSCQTGIPPEYGYRRIAIIEDIESLSFRDDNEGIGLVPGVNYCYFVTAYFANNAESMVSNEACASLRRDLPIITHISNDSTDLEGGKVFVAWAKPTELDTIQYPGPYTYELFRNLQQQQVSVYQGSGLDDTLFMDNAINLNELQEAVYYSVLLKSGAMEVGYSKTASSIFLQISPTDRALLLSWDAQVSWQNDSTEVFRLDEASGLFEKSGVSFDGIYLDEHLENERDYTYYVRTIGSLGSDFVHPIINYSQLVTAVPIDNVPPCPPLIIVDTNCETIENTVILEQVYDSCSYDVSKFQIFYIPSIENDYRLVATIDGYDRSYIHGPLDNVTGCYYVQAVDSTGNISEPSNIYCVDYDVCPIISFPNVFTPNADQINDLFVPFDYPQINPNANIESLTMIIMNRWGNIVFETTNPAVEWDGKNQRNGQDCAVGTYFYICEVYFRAFDRLVQQRLQGSITLIR